MYIKYNSNISKNAMIIKKNKIIYIKIIKRKN